MTKTARKKLINRLHRLSGQLGGIEKMIENDEQVNNVLMQVDAIKAGADSFKRNYVKEHVRSTLSKELESILEIL